MSLLTTPRTTGSRYVSPPGSLAYNLADLQAVAEAAFGMSKADTLKVACELYERGLITYPRVEERHLETGTFEEAGWMVRNFGMASGDHSLDPTWKGPVWVDKVEGDHLGISLTNIHAAAVFGVDLSGPQTQIYGLVHERFLSFFRRSRPSIA